jgi:hypothetical protein
MHKVLAADDSGSTRECRRGSDNGLVGAPTSTRRASLDRDTMDRNTDAQALDWFLI